MARGSVAVHAHAGRGRTHKPLLSSRRTHRSTRRCRTATSFHICVMTGAQRLRRCTGSSGSSHQPRSSPPCSSFWSWILPSANAFFHDDAARTEGSSAAAATATGDVGSEREPGGMMSRGRGPPLSPERDGACPLACPCPFPFPRPLAAEP